MSDCVSHANLLKYVIPLDRGDPSAVLLCLWLLNKVDKDRYTVNVWVFKDASSWHESLQSMYLHSLALTQDQRLFNILYKALTPELPTSFSENSDKRVKEYRHFGGNRVKIGASHK